MCSRVAARVAIYIGIWHLMMYSRCTNPRRLRQEMRNQGVLFGTILEAVWDTIDGVSSVGLLGQACPLHAAGARAKAIAGARSSNCRCCRSRSKSSSSRSKSRSSEDRYLTKFVRETCSSRFWGQHCTKILSMMSMLTKNHLHHLGEGETLNVTHPGACLFHVSHSCTHACCSRF